MSNAVDAGFSSFISFSSSSVFFIFNALFSASTNSKNTAWRRIRKIVIIAQHVIIETQRRIVDGRRKRLDAVQ
jgi:hypothetical protein